MATDRKEVEFIIKANNLSSKTLKEVTDAVDKLNDTIDKQAEAAKKGETRLSELNSSYKKLEEAGKALLGQQALIDRFNAVSAAVEGARDKTAAAASALNQFRFALAQTGGGTKEQQANLAKLEKSADGANKKLQQQVTTLSALDAELKRAGVDTSALAADQERLVASATRVAAAQAKASSAIDDVHAARPAAQQPGGGENPFESSGRTTLSLMQRIRGEVLALTAAYVGLQGAMSGAAAALSAMKDEQAIQSKLLVLSEGDAKKAGDEYKYMREQAVRLGMYFPDFAKQYTSFALAVKQGGKVTEEQTKFIFESVAGLGRVLHLSNDDLNGIFTAMQQIASKGQLMSEELKGQIGERLPGAVALAAKQFGMSTQDFTKALEKGQVSAEAGLTALGRAAQALSKDGIGAAQQALEAQENLFKTALFDFQKSIAEAGFADAFKRLLAELTNFFKSQDGQALAKSLADGFTAVADALTYVVKNLDTFKSIAEGLIGLYLSKQLFSMALGAAEFTKELVALSRQLNESKGAVANLQKGFLLLQSFIIGWEIGKVLSDKFEVVRQIGVSLVIGFEKIWTQIQYGAEIVWASIATSWDDAAAVLINEMTSTFRTILSLMQKAANAVGATGIGDGIGKALDAITLKQTQAAKSKVADLRKNMEAELKRIDAIGEQMFNDASDAAKAARAKASQTTQALPQATADTTGKPTLSTSKDEAEKALKKYQELLAEVQAVEAQSMKKQKDDIESAIAGIDKQYEALFAKIKTSGIKQAGELTTALRAAVEALKSDAIEQYAKRQQDQVDRVKKSFAEIETKLGKGKDATLQDRQTAIADNYANVYKEIAGLDDAHKGNLKDQLDLMVKQLQALEAQKYAIDQAAEAQKQLNDLVAARDARIKVVTDLTSGGLITEAEGRERIQKIIESTQPALEKQAEASRQVVEANKDLLDPAQYERLIANIDLATASWQKYKTEIYSTAQAQHDLAAGLAGNFTNMLDLIGQAAAGVKTWGDVWREVGVSILQTIGNIIKKIIEAQIEAAILKAIQGAAGGAGGAAAAKVAHSGGVVGSLSRTRSASPSWFAGAPKYHSGGVAGLAPDEYPAILKKNEEVLTTDDPRNVLNGGANGGQATPVVQDVKVINTIDSGSFVSEGLSTPAGTRAVFNFISANRNQVKTLLGA